MFLRPWILCTPIATPLATGAPSSPSQTFFAVAGVCTPTWIPTFGPQGTLAQLAADLAVADLGAGPALIVAGDLGATRSTPLRAVAKWTGSTFTPLGSLSTNARVYELAVHANAQPSGLYFAGTFLPGGGVAHWNGTSFIRLSAPVTELHGLGAHDFGAGTRFVVAGRTGGPGRLHAWDGANWPTLPGDLLRGGGLARDALAVQCFDDGGGRALYVGGDVATIDSQSNLSGIARSDEGAWTSVGGGIVQGGACALAARNRERGERGPPSRRPRHAELDVSVLLGARRNRAAARV